MICLTECNVIMHEKVSANNKIMHKSSFCHSSEEILRSILRFYRYFR